MRYPILRNKSSAESLIYKINNLYSLRRGTRARVTCTGHVYYKSLYRALGALGQNIDINQQLSQDQSIYQPISLMSSSIWIIWQLWARSADSRSYSAITQSFEEILPYCQTLTPHRQDADSDRNPTSIVTGRDSTRFHEIPRVSTKFYLIVKGRFWRQGRSWR